MNINKKVLTDLEIYNKILPKIDFTFTSYGTEKLKSMFENYYFDNHNLNKIQSIIKNIINGSKSRKYKIKKLRGLNKLESSLDWLFNEKYDDLYFKYEFLNIRELLSTFNFLKTYSPAFIFIVYGIIYLVLRYMGIPIDIKSYLTNIYRSYQMMIMSLLFIFLNNIKMISFLSNLLATLYVFYQCYSSYNSLESSINHYNRCQDFRNNFLNLKKFIVKAKQIIKKDRNVIKIYPPNEQLQIIDSINFLDQKLSYSNISSFGNILLIKRDCDELKPYFEIITDYIGLVDVYINTARLVRSGYIFPQYDFESQIPYVNAKGLWTLHINNKHEQVLNDCKLGDDIPNTMILTGPNTAGKSTYIRNIMLTVLFSQTLGISPCQSLTFTPFANLFTYLDIPNISRNRESLFEAEVHRCLDFCKTLEKIPPNIFSFTIMDELFTGTNPEEGIASSYAVCEYLGMFDNSIMIVTTHFNKLTELPKIYRRKFINKKFFVLKNADGSFYRPYMIADGVSDQNIAIELLRNKGYNSVIIERAIKLLINETTT